MLTFLFWLFCIAALYSYFIYPLVLRVLVARKGVKTNAAVVSSSTAASVSLIVTAYNEELRVRAKIENSLQLEFDASAFEIIVASDCSSDATDEIVREYADRGVRLVRAPERLGKEHAQQCAIEKASGEILVFSDVATEIPADAIKKLVAYFNDPSVGAVSSEDRFISQNGTVAGEGAYVKYEMWLRQQESRLAGLVGLSGSFFAVRKSLCSDWDIHSPSDFNTALNTAKAGLRAVTAPDVLGFYQDLKDPSKEYQRKIRTVIRGMTGLSRHAEVLRFGKFGFFSFQVISHKLMRWLTPWFLLALFLTNALIADDGVFYFLTFFAQLVFYCVAVVAHFLPNLQSISIIKLVYFFVQVNIALLDAGIKFIAGQRMTTWKPSAR
ncbi:glycosyltransferase family 2 protein [Cellvibrio sp. pealriver]|uniref:glycosyltransferase family 2 protein n=1 Tax=Cellvibrio sp. pealriver TaxID=1622269 RepID=UPI00066FCAF0|nr:glycosyltransferase family 2 protein [Cellvibrio sp. pealriver]